MPTYDNPYDVSIDGNPITGVVAVSISESAAVIRASADTDTHDSIARHGTRATRGTITTLDPEQAEAAGGNRGTLIFKLHDVEGGAAKTGTVLNASTAPWTAGITRDGASSCTVPFIAESAVAYT